MLILLSHLNNQEQYDIRNIYINYEYLQEQIMVAFTSVFILYKHNTNNYLFFNCIQMTFFKITFVRPPQSLHTISMQSPPGEFAEAFGYIKITQRTHFEESHPILSRVSFRFPSAHLSFER